MAIKIKKKTAEVEGEEQTDAMSGASGMDVLEDTSLRTVAWAENNIRLIVGASVALVVVVLGVFFALSYTENQRVEASSVFSESLLAYEILVEGSPELEAFKANPEIEAPSVTFATEEEKWETIHEHAARTLDQHSTGAISQSARMAKAAASFNLGKHDEAIALYNDVLNAGPTEDVQTVAYLGLANSYAAQGKVDEATAQFDKLLGARPEHAGMVRYEKARLLQRTGKVDQAKELYHEILEADPETSLRSDIERRLAML